MREELSPEEAAALAHAASKARALRDSRGRDLERHTLAARIAHEQPLLAPTVRTMPGAFACTACKVARIDCPGVCPACFRAEAERERVERIERALKQIPPRFRWARLELRPFSAPFAPPAASPAAIDAARAWRGSLLVLRGARGSGKTSIAAALLREAIEAGDERAWFVQCEDLSPDAPVPERAAKLLDRALYADFLVLDDMGADLSCAPAGGGLAAYRGDRVRRVIRRRHLYTGSGVTRPLRTVITVGLDDDQIASAYGDDVRRRIVEDSADTTILRLRGAT